MLFVLGLGDALETRKRAPDGSDPERNKLDAAVSLSNCLFSLSVPSLSWQMVVFSKDENCIQKQVTFSHLRSDWLCNTTHTQSEFHFISRAFTPIWGEILADCNETMEGEVRLSTHSARPGFQS